MARGAREPEPTQADTTAPRPVTPDGRTLDRWGLPLTGPARVAALAGRADPNDDPDGWSDAPAAPAPDPAPQD